MGEASEVVIPLFGVLDVTGEVILMWVIALLLVLTSIFVTRHLKERPGRFQNMVETAVESLDRFLPVLSGKRRRESISVFSARCLSLSSSPTTPASFRALG